MNFSDIIKDLIKLEGIRLNSIRPGAEITIRQVDIDQKKVIVESSSGKLQSRSFSEFQRIWEALLSSRAIRVEEVLNGSGSSRNQPETIFANLPYIQWLKIDNKKHISYIGKSTHPFGTIQQMDSLQAALLKNEEYVPLSGRITLVVTNCVSEAASTITTHTGIVGKASSGGFYEFKLSGSRIVLADTNKIQLPCGTYVEISCPQYTQTITKVYFFDQCWGVVSEHGFNAIFRI